MNVIDHLIEEPRACPYLPNERARLELCVALDVSPPELDTWLDQGWRRFGPVYFRPSCGECSRCISLRVKTDVLRLNASQRRSERACERLRRIVREPTVDTRRLELYARWHANREATRGWEPNPQSSERYALDFAFPHPSARELAFYDDDAGGKLVGVSLFDETPRALSAAFFFYDPSYARMSLGTANVLFLASLARAGGRAYLYLGYSVENCPSLQYKERFGPAEALLDRPRTGEVPVWRPFGPSDS
ncbi:MAG: arginyltransferase [Polyangiaceae bacterium]|jgi:arginine-tRNA-protein transferase